MIAHVTFAGGKGGVGKSTVASSMMYYLKDAIKFIAVDADADAPNLHIIFNVDNPVELKEQWDSKVAVIDEERCIKCGTCYEKCPYQSIDKLNSKYVVDPTTCEGCGVCAYFCPVKAISFRKERTGKIMLFKTRYGFSLISAQLDVGRPNSGKLVTTERLWAQQIASNNNLDYVLIDAAAGIGCQVIASISGAKHVFLVTEDTPASLHDVERAYRVAEHFKIKSSVIINKVGLSQTNLVEKWAKENGIEILGNVPYDSAVPKSMSMRKPLPEAFPNSKASKALKDIANSVLDVLENIK